MNKEPAPSKSTSERLQGFLKNPFKTNTFKNAFGEKDFNTDEKNSTKMGDRKI